MPPQDSFDEDDAYEAGLKEGVNFLHQRFLWKWSAIAFVVGVVLGWLLG